jgi:hypothetical protein
MVSFSGRISALTQGCVHRVHRTQKKCDAFLELAFIQSQAGTQKS